MKPHPLRLKPNKDLKIELMNWTAKNKIEAAFIISGLGSLKALNLRFAGNSVGTRMHGSFEIISLSGTLSVNEGHIHICVSNEKGETFGGHLLDGNIIYTTVEILIVELGEYTFKREFDAETGYNELMPIPK